MRIAVKSLLQARPSEAEISTQQFVATLNDYWATVSGDERRRTHLVLDRAFHLQLVKVDLEPGSTVSFADPKIHVREVDGAWLFVSWHYDATKDGVDGTMFCFRESMEALFEHFPVPTSTTVAPDGALTIGDGFRSLRFPSDQKPWPWPLTDLKRYYALGLVNTLLTPDDRNELTSLLHCPHPYKGMGFRLKDWLIEIQAALLMGEA